VAIRLERTWEALQHLLFSHFREGDVLNHRAVVVLVVVAVLLGVWSCYLVVTSKPVVQREAETDASLRLIAEFHEEYLDSNGVPLNEYKVELAALKEKHLGPKELRRYAEKVSAR
jgi:hypothetical protein